MSTHTRRTFLLQAGMGAVSLYANRVFAERSNAKSRLILLGTAGGPTPKITRAAPAQVIVCNSVAYVIDCGNGVSRQLTLAGVPLSTLRHVFITHQHSDHNADYGTLLLLAWSSGLRTPVDTWGPPPLARMTDLFFQMSAADLQVREADEGKPPLRPLIRVHDLTADGPIMEDANVRVRCALVHHPLLKTAFAYRFDASDRSIVISGDTTRSENLIQLAKGADVLVHEALYLPAVEEMAGSEPESVSLRKHIVESHTPVEEVGKIASEAGVKTLVLSHLLPSERPRIPDDVWLQGARTHFKGRIIVGKDLMEI